MIEQHGNTVKINNKLIPAVNIQVEGVPGYIESDDGHRYWYGIYFEVLFEDATLWEVCQGSEIQFKDRITITEWKRWGLGFHQISEGVTVEIPNWDAFVSVYEEKCQLGSISMN